jgi:hypothetical protein
MNADSFMLCRPRWLTRLAPPACVALAFAAAATSRAEEEKEPVAIRYVAPPTCPREDEMRARLAARTMKTRPLQPGERGRQFDLEVAATGEGARGRVTIKSPDGGAVARQITGKTCDEVVAAMVLVTALAIDPRAALGPLPEPSAAPTTAPRAGSSSRPAGAPRGPQRVASAEPAPSAIAAATPRPPPPRVTFALGATGIVALGIEPSAALGGGGFLAVEWERASPWAPSMRFGIDATAASDLRLEAGSARFSWFAAHLDLCPLRLGGPAVTVSPCLLGEAGQLTATGLEVPKAARETRNWMAAGALGRVAVPIAGPIVLEASLAIVFPIRRYDFVFTPSTEVDRVSPIGGRFGLGARARFP